MSGWMHLAACAVLLFLVAWSSAYVVRVTHEHRQLYGELQEVQARHDELLTVQSRLVLERGALASYQTIERVAQNDLKMRFPTNVEYVEP